MSEKGSGPPVEVTEYRKLRDDLARSRRRWRWELAMIFSGWFLGNVAAEIVVVLIWGP